MFILRTLLLAGLSCSSLLFCPSPAEVEQALTELTIPELLGTSEQQTACDVYLTHHTKYADLISDIERHIASNTDAAQLTEYASMLGGFLKEVNAAIHTITQLCERVAASEKDSYNMRVLIEDLMDIQHRLSCMTTEIKTQYTATNIAIATAIAQNEPAPQEIILDDCVEQQRQRPCHKPTAVPFEAPEDTPQNLDNQADDSSSLNSQDSYGFNSDDFESDFSDEEDSTSPALHHAVLLGAEAQQAITLNRPMAEAYEFAVVGKACAHQGMTLNCGYHAVCNAQVVAKGIQGIDIINTAIQNGLVSPQMTGPEPIKFETIPLPATLEILQRKNTFLRTTGEVINPASAITGFTLAAFAEFNQSLISTPTTPPLYQSTTQPTVYFDALEYMQNKEREIIVDILELVAFFNASDANKQLLWNFLQGFVVDLGVEGIQTVFPDQQLPIPGTPFSTEILKNAYLFWRAVTTQGTYGSYTNAITAFKAGKTLVIPWLSHSGAHAGCGHWTCKVFVPEMQNGAIIPNFARIINIDSCDASGVHAHIDDNVKRFVFDLLHLELPSATDLDTIAQIFNPRSIFAERYLLEESAAMSMVAAPQAVL